eukprot:1976260-Amphidinium_carterae.1
MAPPNMSKPRFFTVLASLQCNVGSFDADTHPPGLALRSVHVADGDAPAKVQKVSTASSED